MVLIASMKKIWEFKINIFNPIQFNLITTKTWKLIKRPHHIHVCRSVNVSGIKRMETKENIPLERWYMILTTVQPISHLAFSSRPLKLQTWSRTLLTYAELKNLDLQVQDFHFHSPPPPKHSLNIFEGSLLWVYKHNFT